MIDNQSVADRWYSHSPDALVFFATQRYLLCIPENNY